MATDLDDQDWLDMDNVEQVGPPASGRGRSARFGNRNWIDLGCIPNSVCVPKPSMEPPVVALLETAAGVWGCEAEKG